MSLRRRPHPKRKRPPHVTTIPRRLRRWAWIVACRDRGLRDIAAKRDLWQTMQANWARSER